MLGLAKLSQATRHYMIVTGNYWVFTLSDGALRMLIVLYFHNLGYGAFAIATLFLFYEFFGVVTNLVGGWLGARLGLNVTMNLGLAIQILALCLLLVPEKYLSIPWVIMAQALSGIAKDLNKMSAKSAIKTLIPATQEGRLFKWVAILTGSKNALKGFGFFLGGGLLTLIGFQGAILVMAIGLFGVWVVSLFALAGAMGKASFKPKFRNIFSKSPAINILSAARMFLFGARDIWFVVALPVYMATILEWNYTHIGALLAVWVMVYGLVQTLTPFVASKHMTSVSYRTQVCWVTAILLGCVSSILLGFHQNLDSTALLIWGLFAFGIIFAVNSALHSYLIVSYAGTDGVSLDVGFYYMANAMGRLIGTLLSGYLYQYHGIEACLAGTACFIAAALVFSFKLPRQS